MTKTFNDFVNVIRKNPKIRIKINDMLDRYMRLPFNYRSEIGYDTLIQKFNLKELNNIMGTTITHLDVELKMKISRKKYLEGNYYDYLILFNINDYYILKRKISGVSFQNKGWIKVEKFQDIPGNKIIIYCVKPLESFLGKSKSCMMTAMSRAFDKSVFDGNTILHKISEEIDRQRYFFGGGDTICSFLTNDKIYKYISNMGNILTPYSIMIGWETIYFLTSRFKLVKKEEIHDDDDVVALFD